MRYSIFWSIFYSYFGIFINYRKIFIIKSW